MPHLRDEVVRMLHDELVGPARHLPAVQTGIEPGDKRNEEILRAEDPPRSRYGAGILFPGGVRVETQDDLNRDEVPEMLKEASDLAEAEEDEPESALAEATNRAESGADVSTMTDLEVNRANEFLPSALGLTALIRIPQKLVVTVDAAT